MLTIFAAVLTGYLLGSIPTGVWLGKSFRNIDIREHGSRSTGATNVFRVLGARLAIIVLIIDIAKGFLASYIASRIDLGDTLMTPMQMAIIGGVSAIVGHLFPLFAKFKGGKGVATGTGMLIFMAPLEVAFALVVFAVTLALTRYVSLGSILATFFFSLAIILQKYVAHYPIGNEMIGLGIFVMLLILHTHRANIDRLLKGKENKLGAGYK